MSKRTTKPTYRTGKMTIKSRVVDSGDGWQIIAETIPHYGTDYIVFVSGERVAGATNLFDAQRRREEYTYELLKRAA